MGEKFVIKRTSARLPLSTLCPVRQIKTGVHQPFRFRIKKYSPLWRKFPVICLFLFFLIPFPFVADILYASCAAAAGRICHKTSVVIYFFFCSYKMGNVVFFLLDAVTPPTFSASSTSWPSISLRQFTCRPS